jgi:hypothetical protein
VPARLWLTEPVTSDLNTPSKHHIRVLYTAAQQPHPIATSSYFSLLKRCQNQTDVLKRCQKQPIPVEKWIVLSVFAPLAHLRRTASTINTTRSKPTK